jgi:hypothetical protein
MAEFGKNSRIHFKTTEAGDVCGDRLEIRGIRDEHVFWDHEVIRQRYNHIIMRYHEYD